MWFSEFISMWLLLLPTILICLALFVVRKVCVDALSSVVTREADTLKRVRIALRALGSSVEYATFVPTKDRSSALCEGTSRRKGGRITAKKLQEKRKREEKLAAIRKDLAAKLKFKKG